MWIEGLGPEMRGLRFRVFVMLFVGGPCCLLRRFGHNWFDSKP